MAVYKTQKHKYSFKKNSFKKTAFKALVLLTLFFIIFILFLYFPKFRIKNIEIRGNKNLAQKTRTIINEELNKKMLFLIPKNNFFIFKKRALTEKILKNLTSVKTIEINKNFPDTIILNIKERERIGVYCVNEEVLKCYSLDNEAEIFEETIFYEEEKKLIFIKSGTSTETAKQNEKIMDKKIFTALISFLENAEKSLRLRTKKIILKKDEYEIFFEDGFYAILDKKQINIAFENLKLILESQIKDKKNNLEYIDLRFQNKAFFKLK